jgi:type I restriction enzyme S subunit
MTEWLLCSIGDLERSGEAALQTGPFGTQLKASEYIHDGVPVINVRNIGFGEVRKDDLEFLGEVKADALKQHQLRIGDIVFGRKGAVERHALIDHSTHGWIQGSDCLRLRLNTTRVHASFLSAYFKTQAHQDWMQALCSFGATMSSLNQDIVRRITFLAPTPETQRKISAILAAYDELIENNRRKIDLLERMAEELYREWFVRFRFPGHERAHFSKGIPSDWQVVQLSTIARINARSIKNGSEPEAIRYLDIGAVSTNTYKIPEPIPFQTAPGRARRLVSHGDMIWSTVRPANRSYCLVIDPPKNLVVSTGFAVISPRESIPFAFVKFVVTGDGFVDLMAAQAKGAAYPATSFDDLSRANVLLPNQELVEEFGRLATPLLLQSHSLQLQCSVLKKTRNHLLPRLISGKLRVDELDIQFPPSMQPQDI